MFEVVGSRFGFAISVGVDPWIKLVGNGDLMGTLIACNESYSSTQSQKAVTDHLPGSGPPLSRPTSGVISADPHDCESGKYNIQVFSTPPVLELSLPKVEPPKVLPVLVLLLP